MPLKSQGKRGTERAEGKADGGGGVAAASPPASLGVTSFTNSATIEVRLDALLSACPAVAGCSSLTSLASQAKHLGNSARIWVACRLVHIVFEAQPFAVYAFETNASQNTFSTRIQPEHPDTKYESRGAKAGQPSEFSALPRRHPLAEAGTPGVACFLKELSLYKHAVYFVSVTQDRNDTSDVFPIFPAYVRISNSRPPCLVGENAGTENQGELRDPRAVPKFVDIGDSKVDASRKSLCTNEQDTCVKGVFNARVPCPSVTREGKQDESQPPNVDLSIFDHLQATSFCKVLAREYPQPIILQVAFERLHALEFQGTFIGAQTSVIRAGTILASTIHSLLPPALQSVPSTAQSGLQARRERRLRLLAERRKAYRQGQVAEFFIEDILTGVTIGRQGERLGRLAKQYQVEIRVLPNEQGFRRVCIYGKSEAAVAQVQAELESVYRLVYVRPEGLTSWTSGTNGQRAAFLQNLAQRCGLHALWIDVKLAALIVYGSRAAGEAFQKMLRISGHTTPGTEASTEPVKVSPSASRNTQLRVRWPTLR